MGLDGWSGSRSRLVFVLCHSLHGVGGQIPWNTSGIPVLLFTRSLRLTDGPALGLGYFLPNWPSVLNIPPPLTTSAREFF